ncbi:hypothetical protein JZ00_03515 [Pseudomonas frederiksbergensis]|uniref:Uncharacterized protein n=1 Tax=Pseudomonas frederiksbergensis TaxID=104087 RepID=A0A0B1Z8Y8_9PSED|nr:hypothetical protein JZ00_03515 [Pseudomonas frederiksbergensis]
MRSDMSVPSKRNDMLGLPCHKQMPIVISVMLRITGANSSPSKNDFYAQAGMGNPSDPCGYDTAQQQEALRTAYVAITRAVTYCYWYITWDEKVPASEKASRHIVAGEAFWDVVGHRPASRSDGVKRKAL